MQTPTSTDQPNPFQSEIEDEGVKFKFKEPLHSDRMILWVLLAMIGGFALTFGAQSLAQTFHVDWLQKLADFLFNGGMMTDAVWQGQIWRPLTAAFLHGGMFHIFGNAVNFVIVALMCRTLFARRGWLVIFLVSAYLGAVVTILFTPHVQLVGASVGIMGLFGALVAGELRQRKIDRRKLPAEELIPLKTLLFLLALQLVLEHLIPNVGHIAHASGLAIGFLLGLFLPLNAGVRMVASRKDLIDVTGVTKTTSFKGKVRGLTVVDSFQYKESEEKPGDWLAVIQEEYGPQRLCKATVQDLIGDSPELDDITDQNSVFVADRFSLPQWDAKHPDAPGINEVPPPEVKTPVWERVVYYLAILLVWRYLFLSWAPSMLYDKAALGWLHALPAPFDGWAIDLGSKLGALIVTYFAASLIGGMLVGAIISFGKGFFGASKKDEQPADENKS